MKNSQGEEYSLEDQLEYKQGIKAQCEWRINNKHINPMCQEMARNSIPKLDIEIQEIKDKIQGLLEEM